MMGREMIAGKQGNQWEGQDTDAEKEADGEERIEQNSYLFR
jgi:hypothetical protein